MAQLLAQTSPGGWPAVVVVGAWVQEWEGAWENGGGMLDCVGFKGGYVGGHVLGWVDIEDKTWFKVGV
jgi:hypothetical protein